MKIAVCDDDKGCLDSMKRLLAGYPGISRTEYYQNLSQLSEALENGMGYDLVLMDIEWEGNEQDGIAYAAQYNARSPQTSFPPYLLRCSARFFSASKYGMYKYWTPFRSFFVCRQHCSFSQSSGRRFSNEYWDTV